MAHEELRPPASFKHPYTPYPSQLELMTQLYDAAAHSRVAILESPTGTGKTLSIICSLFQWLQDDLTLRRKQAVAAPTAASTVASTVHSTADDEPSWITDFDAAHEQAEARRELKRGVELEDAVLQRMEVVRADDTRAMAAAVHGTPSRASLIGGGSKRPRGSEERRYAPDARPARAVEVDEEDDCALLGDYASDDDGADSRRPRSAASKHTHSVADDLRAHRDGEDSSEAIARSRARVAEHAHVTPKIFYASRTHSQIAQFVHEIAKTAFSHLRVVTLGSRRTLCVNPDVTALKSETRMNEACRELMDGRARTQAATAAPRHDAVVPVVTRRAAPASTGCPFYSSAGHVALAERLLARTRDIEEAAALGAAMHACAYYGSREAVALAHVVCVPYSLLLTPSSRDSSGIVLDGSVVVIDEAHNLMDAINATHSCTLTYAHVCSSLRLLRAYITKYAPRMQPSNTARCNQLVHCVEALLATLSTARAAGQVEGRSVTGETPLELRGAAHTCALTVEAFLTHATLDRFNIPALITYVSRVDLARKLRGFAERGDAPRVATTASGDDSSATDGITAFQQLVSFLSSVAACSAADARVIVSALPAVIASTRGGQSAEAYVRFIHLDAHSAFADITRRARSVILIGGTMQPVADVIRNVFPDVPSARLRTFSCGHIIPPSSLQVHAITHGPHGHALDFRHAARTNAQQVAELGDAILALARVVPAGLVVFLPSYDYERCLLEAWSLPAGSAMTSVMDKLAALKSVFREPQAAADMDKVLRAYSAAATGVHTADKENMREHGNSASGAVLFAVMGGKMSEGINFSDDLARGVVVVGLPYANSGDPELQERLRFMDRRGAGAATTPDGAAWSGHAWDMYENMCMKTVNQSIGRSIRHARDYACIMLLDQRFGLPRIQAKLPRWIASQTATMDASRGWEPITGAVTAFFDARASVARATS